MLRLGVLDYLAIVHGYFRFTYGTEVLVHVVHPVKMQCVSGKNVVYFDSINNGPSRIHESGSMKHFLVCCTLIAAVYIPDSSVLCVWCLFVYLFAASRCALRARGGNCNDSDGDDDGDGQDGRGNGIVTVLMVLITVRSVHAVVRQCLSCFTTPDVVISNILLILRAAKAA